MAEAGLDEKDEIERKARIKRFSIDYLLRKQETRGHKLSPEETREAVYELQAITAPSHWGWVREREPLFDIEFNEVPSTAEDSIRTVFLETYGISDPSDADVLNAYIELQIEEAEIKSRLEQQ